MPSALSRTAADVQPALALGTGAIARTATNIRAGGKTPVAGMAHAIFVLVFMLVAAPLVGYFTLPTLAAVLLVTAWNMSEPHRLGHDLRARREDVAVLLLTLFLTVMVDLTTAIGAGLILAFALRFRRRDVPPPDWQAPDS